MPFVWERTWQIELLPVHENDKPLNESNSLEVEERENNDRFSLNCRSHLHLCWPSSGTIELAFIDIEISQNWFFSLNATRRRRDFSWLLLLQKDFLFAVQSVPCCWWLLSWNGATLHQGYFATYTSIDATSPSAFQIHKFLIILFFYGANVKSTKILINVRVLKKNNWIQK